MTSKEILNSEEVEFLLDTGKAAGGQKNATEPAAQQAVTMRGDLEQIDLTDIFQTLGLTKMEGLLKLQNPVQQQLVHFREGQVKILVSPRSTTRRLGQRLVQAGLINPEQLRLALLEQRKEHRPIGTILVENGWVDAGQIDSAIKLQITEELFGLFTWERGEFEFYRGEVTDPTLKERIDVCPAFEVGTLLLEVARRADEWDAILETLGSLDEVPVQVAQAPGSAQLDELQRALLVAVDGRHSYREISGLTLLSVFDCARSARELVLRGFISRASDEQLLGVARWHLEQDDAKKAVMVAQTLRDRDGDRPLPVVRELANVLRAANETMLAGKVLLEAAQLQADADTALTLAREARAQSPRDLGVLSFLRTTMLAHLPAASPEVEEVTLALLDGLFADGETDRVLAITAEARQVAGATPALLMREARALARKKDNPGAVRVLVEAAAAFAAAGQRDAEIEAYELAARLDRDRKDIRRTLKTLRMTRRGRLIRIGAYSSVALLLLASGLTWYSARAREDRVRDASQEIAELLRNEQAGQAAAALARWRAELGACPEIDDLQQQIRFVESAMKQRQQRKAEMDAAAQLQAAGSLVLEGKLDQAFAIYDAMQANDALAAQVQAAAQSRLDALAHRLEDTAKHLPDLLPDPPTDLTERQQIEETLTQLRRNVEPQLLAAAETLLQLRAQGHLPARIDAGRRDKLLRLAERAAPLLRRGLELAKAYEAAGQRIDTERRMDPLFKAALAAERKLDFAGALVAYKELLAARAGGAEVQREFQKKVDQLTGIVNVCATIDAATKSGDFATASRELQALRRAQPQIPFDRVVRLPVHLRTSLPGAGVHWNGEDLGRTPLLTSYLPAVENVIELQLPRFDDVRVTLPRDNDGTLEVVLTLRPDWQTEIPASIDQRMTMDRNGRVFAVDRDGAVLAFDTREERLLWRHETNDAAGYLSPPLVHENLLFVASLDGTLRALSANDGSIAWQHPGLPAGNAPALVDGRLAVATTDGKLVLLEPDRGDELQRIALPAAADGDLLEAGGRLIVPAGEQILAFAPRELSIAWQHETRALGPNLRSSSAGLVAVRDDGLVQLVDPATGAVRWQKALRATPVGRPSVSDTDLLVTLDDRLVLLALQSGQEIWSARRPECGWVAAAEFAGQHILAPTRDGWLLTYGRNQQGPRYRLQGDRRDFSVAGDADAAALVAAGRRCFLYRRVP